MFLCVLFLVVPLAPSELLLPLVLLEPAVFPLPVDPLGAAVLLEPVELLLPLVLLEPVELPLPVVLLEPVELPFPVVLFWVPLFVMLSTPSTTSSTTFVMASPASSIMEPLPLFAELPFVTLLTLELFPAVPDALLLAALPDPDWEPFPAVLPLLPVVLSLVHATAKHIKPSVRLKVRSFRVPAIKFDFFIFFIASSILLCELKIKTITYERNG